MVVRRVRTGRLRRQQRAWIDATTKGMEEHNNEGGGATGEDWKMKTTTKVVVRRRLVSN